MNSYGNLCLIHSTLKFTGSMRMKIAARTVTCLYSLISVVKQFLRITNLAQISKPLFRQRIEMSMSVSSEIVTYARIYIVV